MPFWFRSAADGVSADIVKPVKAVAVRGRIVRTKEITSIGGGASGLMSAIWAARSGARVTVLEANEKPGKKLLASGNGKCNLTNLAQSPDCYRGSDPAFLWQIIRQFPAEKTIAFFTGLGLYIKNRDWWVYPYSEQAGAVLNALLMEAEHLKVKIKTRESVESVRREDGRFITRTASWQYESDAVILACGSPASAVKGSSDLAVRIADDLDLPFLSFMPALVPLRIRENYSGRWGGTRAEGAVRLFINGEQAAEARGNIQLAGYGISGIPVFQISRFAVRAIRERGDDVRVLMDFFPDCEEEELLARIRQQRARCPYQSTRQLLGGMLPEALVPVIMDTCQSDEDLVRRIKRLALTITDAASGAHAQVSSGGIDTRCLGSDLQVKKLPGFYAAGEAIDADGTCGGYNLQWAWSSGYTAGVHAAAQ